MIGATIGVAFFFAILALSRRHGGATLGILIMSMLLWPEYLRVPIGLVQMSVPRLVALVLLLKFIATGRNRRINFGKVDTLVILIWLWTILATIITGAESYQVTQMIGRGLDTVLMYFVARMALTTPSDVKGLYFGLAFTAVFMCGMGVLEAITWHSPYHKFYEAMGYVSRIYNEGEIRHGMLRAQGSTLVSIYFGMAMMLVAGLLWSIRGYIAMPFILKSSILAAVIGVLSSLSSGPWTALIIFIGLNVYFKRTSLIKPSVYAIVFLSILAEVVSNRHFYNLIDYLALEKQTAWYRTRLMEVAVSQWRYYWLLGCGSNWPNHWGAMIDGRKFIDVVNNFLIIALYGGLPAMFMYLATHIIAIKRTVRAWGDGLDISRRKLLFGLAASLVALDFSSMSVGLFGPALLLSHILLGVSISVSTAWNAQGSQSTQNEPLNNPVWQLDK